MFHEILFTLLVIEFTFVIQIHFILHSLEYQNIVFNYTIEESPVVDIPQMELFPKKQHQNTEQTDRAHHFSFDGFFDSGVF